MADIVTDEQIAALLVEPKTGPASFWQQASLRPKHGHKEAEVLLQGTSGNVFRIIMRQATINPLDFSVILAWDRPGVTGRFLLRRYNGRQHSHKNPIEGKRFFAYHVHTATRRYQERGMDPETFAEPDARYATLRDALRCLMIDCNVHAPGTDQPGLFDAEVQS